MQANLLCQELFDSSEKIAKVAPTQCKNKRNIGFGGIVQKRGLSNKHAGFFLNRPTHKDHIF